MIIGFTNMEIIGDFVNKRFTGEMGKIQIGIYIYIHIYIYIYMNEWVHFIMYKLYLNKVNLKAQEERKYEIG